MLNVHELTSKIKYENVFNEIDESISKTCLFSEKVKQDKQLYWDEVSKLLCSINSIKSPHTHSYVYDLLHSNDLHDFIKLNYDNLNIEILSKYSFKKELEKFYINNLDWVFQDFNRMTNSFRFIKYTQEKLELILTFYPYLTSDHPRNISPDEKIMYNNFWLNAALYQNLTCTFIQKYFLIFLNPKFAYNLSIGNNQLYNCNFYIIQKIKVAANSYKNK